MAAQEVATSRLDPLLIPLVRSRDEAETHRLVTEIITLYAAPIIKRVVGQRLSIRARDGRVFPHPEAEDVYGEVVSAVLRRLSDLKREPDDKLIRDFRGYVAGAATNICAEFFRHNSPQRRSLKNKVRYLVVIQNL